MVNLNADKSQVKFFKTGVSVAAEKITTKIGDEFLHPLHEKRTEFPL
jgi:hypothetical protein